MKPPGTASQVTSEMASAAPPTMVRRRRKPGQRMPLACPRNRLTPTMNRKLEAMQRANSRQPPTAV